MKADSFARPLKQCVRKRDKLVLAGAISGAMVMAALPSQAAFHLWNIREVYSNAGGNLQFVELFCPAGGQTFLNGLQITVTGGGTHTFTLNHGISADSLNRALLFGTAGLQAAGAPAPDYIIPDGFLFTPNGSISFFGANGGSYTSIPLDGVLSRNWGDGNSANSPQNFAGQVGLVTVPEPTTWTLFGLGSVGLALLARRRS